MIDLHYAFCQNNEKFDTIVLFIILINRSHYFSYDVCFCQTHYLIILLVSNFNHQLTLFSFCSQSVKNLT